MAAPIIGYEAARNLVADLKSCKISKVTVRDHGINNTVSITNKVQANGATRFVPNGYIVSKEPIINRTGAIAEAKLVKYLAERVLKSTDNTIVY